MEFTIRRAIEDDAEPIIRILEGIAAERIYTAIDKPWSAAEQRRYIVSLSPREAIHIAHSQDGQIIGYQTLELWAASIASMSHVAQLGTFIAAEWRGRGVGTALFRNTREFARNAAYAKLIIQVRANNLPAQCFYENLGFKQCGRLTRQVRINGDEDDELLYELFL